MAFLTSTSNIPPRGKNTRENIPAPVSWTLGVPEAFRGWKKPEAQKPESRGGCRLVSSGDRTHIFQQTFKRDVASATLKKNRATKNHCARCLLIKIKTNISH